MATVQYFLRSQQKDTDSTIRVRFRHGRGIDLNGVTRFVLPISLWDKKKQRINPGVKYDDSFTFETAQYITDCLGEIETYILDAFNVRVSDNLPKVWLQDIIDTYYRKKDEEQYLREHPKEEEHPETLNEFISRYIEEMKNGKRMTVKGVLYSPGTIKNKVSFQSEFTKFQEFKKTEYNFDDVTIDLYNDFLDFFNKKLYSPNTSGKHIKTFKEIMAASRNEGLHQNFQTTLRAFKILSCEADTVYLTRSEVEAIEKLELTGKPELDKCRNVFLVGVYTAQRYSDYHRIGRDNVIKMENGREAVKLHQAKTGAKVVIPCSPQLTAILQKYNYELPYTYSQLVNENIKLICRMAGITQLVEHTEIKGGLKKIQKVEKCKLISTHTARRTGATLMYLEGLETLSIMKITGHRTEKEFLKYIRVGEEENAIMLSNDKYFNRPNLSISK